MLTDRQIERYSRQIILQPVGGRGQERLLGTAVVVVGDHVAGDTALVYLAAAGVGRLVRVARKPPAAGRSAPDARIETWSGAPNAEALRNVASTCALVVCVGTVAELEPAYEACFAAERALLWGHSEGPLAWVARVGLPHPGNEGAHACPACIGKAIEGVRSADTTLAPAATAWTGAVLATEALKVLLGMPDSPGSNCLAYDAACGTVAAMALNPAGSCAGGSVAPVPVRSPGR